MSWNYRVLKTADQDGSEVWGVHEVYYEPDGTIRSWTKNIARPLGDTCLELHKVLAIYGRALMQPPLDVTNGTAVELTITGRAKRAQRR